MNKVILVGNATREMEVKYTSNGRMIAKTAIAVNKKWRDQNGQMVEKAMFIDIVFFGKLAETAQKFIPKGKKIAISGELVLDQWTAQDGSSRSKHVVHVQDMELLGTANGGGQPQPQPAYGQPQQPAQPQPQPQPQPAYGQPQQPAIPNIEINEEEIPF